ncbi:hypothetical protein [Nocardia sp. alder85J]|uniref:hypothetical protein n=1 Tax=Nocardia sp. alder85J TaxID=2862949 RepID=UPI001CD5D6F1|nr:hypothetical protein [Nocardia sp. alder85J]MCX4095433.1 hypothetical protein [Nocardia sp. alder85J]
MPISRTATPLHRALERYGRTERRLAFDTMASDGAYVLDALTGGRELTPEERSRLAKWVVAQLQRQIAGFSYRADRRMAEVVLAYGDDFEGQSIKLRLKHIRDDDRPLFTDEQFKKHRARVLRRLAEGLQAAYRDARSPRVFVGGSYDDPAWDTVADGMGRALAEQPVQLLAAMSDPGIRICYGLEEARSATGTYQLPRTRLFGRADSSRGTGAGTRLGAIEYLGGTRDSVREYLLAQSNLVLLFGGGPGTAAEARYAEQHGIPVVPLGFTDGTARRYWESHHDDADPETYARLGGPNPRTAIDAAVRMISQLVLPAW